MNDQLIQQLSQQIDGQVTQTVGSHDPQVKGDYLRRTYPQVRSCTSYNEAVVLLAREQAALQQAQQSGFGIQQQNSGFGVQQQSGFGVQPQSKVFGTPQSQQQSGDLASSPQFGAPPQPGIFGTPGVTQQGQAAASQFTAFQPPKEVKKLSGKVFGFIPSSVFAVVLIAIIGTIVIGGIVLSVVNAAKGKNVPDINATIPAVENTYEPSVDDLFGD